jgi:hypothetical protein
MFPQIKPKQLWIGVVEVRPLAGCNVFDETQGAFVEIVAWAASAYEYGRKVSLIVKELRLFVLAVENVEPVEQRRAREGYLEECVEDIIFEAHDNPDAITYGAFHTYEKADV